MTTYPIGYIEQLARPFRLRGPAREERARRQRPQPEPPGARGLLDGPSEQGPGGEPRLARR